MTNTSVITGRLVADVEMRFTPSGKSVASFTVADDYGRKNRDTGKWEKEGSTFLPVEVWGFHGENAAEKLSKGMRVIVVGEIRQRHYQTRDGEKRSVFEVKQVDEVGVLLDKWAPRDYQPAPNPAPSQEDPWGTPVDDTEIPF